MRKRAIIRKNKLTSVFLPEEKRFQALIEHSSDGIVLMSRTGKLLYVSPSAKRIFGYDYTNLSRLKPFTFLHPADRKAVFQNFLTLLTSSGKQTNLQYRVRHADGSYRWVQAVATNLIQNPDIQAIVVNFRDISEQKRNEERHAVLHNITALLTSSLAYEATIKKVLTSIVPSFADYSRLVVIDQDKRITDIRVNHKDKKKQALVEKLYELYMRQDDNTHGVGRILSSGKPELISLVDEQVLKTVADPELLRIISQLGLISYIGVPLVAREKLLGVVTFSSTNPARQFSKDDLTFAIEIGERIAIAIDNARLYQAAQKEIHERKRAEMVVQEREQWFRTLLEKSLDGVRVINEKGKILYASPSIKHILGYSPKEYTSLSVFDLVHPDDRPAYIRVLSQALKTPGKAVQLSYRMRHKNGSYRWLEGIGRNLLRDPYVQAIVSNFHDITERKTAEEALENERNRMRTLLANVPAVVWEAYGKPDTRAQRIDFVSKYVEKMLGYTTKEWLQTPNFWLTIVHPDDYERAAAESAAIFASRRGGISRFRWRRKNGEYIWVEAQSYVITDENGVSIGMRGVTIDITERMELENRKNEFISMASHELKTPVTSIKLFIEVLNKHLTGSDEKTTKILSRLADQTNKLHELISDLLDVSRIQLGKLQFSYETFDITNLIANTVEDIQHTSNRHTLQFEHNGPLKLKADKFRLYQVITNLLTNAIKYSPKGGNVIVSIKKNSHLVVISVADSGIGIAKKDQEKVFNRLYQAKSARERTFSGLGMGLYISKEIISRHNGNIWVTSEKGKGSTFYISLPLKNAN